MHRHHATGLRKCRTENSRPIRVNDLRKNSRVRAAENFAAEILQTVPRVCRFTRLENLLYNNNLCVAEREGFEPPIRLPVCRISSAVLSTTQPPLRGRTGCLPDGWPVCIQRS